MAAQKNATPSRRGLLKIAATAAAAVPVGAARNATQLADAELIALCAEWRRALDRNALVVDRLACRLESDWSEEDHAEWDKTGEAADGLQDRVAETRAMTVAGTQAKAAVLDYMAEVYGIPCPAEFAASLVADLVGLSA